MITGKSLTASVLGVLLVLFCQQAAAQGAAGLRAVGTFEVKIGQLPGYDQTTGSQLGRMSVDKVYSGDLQGTGKGEMLTAMTGVTGSGAYVAVERFTGTLAGKSGSFELQHSGTMARGAQHLLITVVPDSGTGELEGLTGTLSITIENGKHFYSFEYALPGKP